MTQPFHYVVNDLMQKSRSKSDTVENLIENIRKSVIKDMSHGESKFLCRRLYDIKRFPVLEEVNEKNLF